MLTELQAKKFTRLFNVFDVDGNGVLEKADFERIMTKLTELYNIEPASQTYDEMSGVYTNRWDHIQKLADKNQNQQVGLAEWLEYHEEILSANYKDENFVWMKPTIFLCNLMREDGSWTSEEYRTFFKVYGLDEKLAEEIFPQLVRSGDSVLSRDELLQLTRDFYLSNDPQARGNLVFGPYE